MEDDKVLNYRGLKKDIFECKRWVKKYIEENIGGYIEEALSAITSNAMISVTYDELVSLRDNNKLKPGMKYRITDYETMLPESYETGNPHAEGNPKISCAGHRFDIIVTADSTNTLNENAKCIQHEGEDYFNGTKQGYAYTIDDLYYGWDDYYFSFDGIMEYNGKTYYKWKWNSVGHVSEGAYMLTEQDTYYNTPDGNEEHVDYYLTTYDYSYIVTIDGESSEVYYVHPDRTKIIKTYLSENLGKKILLLGDTYELGEEKTYTTGAKCNLNAWEIKYSLDNDTNRFNFARVKVDRYAEKYKIRDPWEGEYVERGAYYTYMPDMTVEEFDNDWHYIRDFHPQYLNGVLYDGDSSIITYYENSIAKSTNLQEGDTVLYCESNGDSGNEGTATEIVYAGGTSCGKGVIYYMKDEWGNEAGYDFKNIIQPDGLYTFGKSLNGEQSTKYFDASLNGYENYCYYNKITPWINDNNDKQDINVIGFRVSTITNTVINDDIYNVKFLDPSELHRCTVEYDSQAGDIQIIRNGNVYYPTTTSLF